MSIIFSILYPRLDINVSIQVNHLLKSPFCVHPSTGKICVPFSPDKVEVFDPEMVPTLETTMLYHQCKVGMNPLYDALRIFDDFISKCEDSRKKSLEVKREIRERSLAF